MLLRCRSMFRLADRSSCCWRAPQLARRSRARRLAPIAFPNSGAPAAQADFMRGVAWLHSFGYEEAIDAFRAAQTDRSQALPWRIGARRCASISRSGFTKSPTRRARRLAKLGPTPAGARREGGDAARADVPGGGRGAVRQREHKPARDKAYCRCDGALAAKFPQDDEAQAFHALSLLATSAAGR